MNDPTPIDPAGGCPVHQPGGVRALLGRTNRDWWPDMLATEMIHSTVRAEAPVALVTGATGMTGGIGRYIAAGLAVNRGLRLDYFWLSASVPRAAVLEVQHLQRLPMHGSDHAPVLLEIDLAQL